jgi:hypothetical protein
MLLTTTMTMMMTTLLMMTTTTTIDDDVAIDSNKRIINLGSCWHPDSNLPCTHFLFD